EALRREVLDRSRRVRSVLHVELELEGAAVGGDGRGIGLARVELRRRLRQLHALRLGARDAEAAGGCLRHHVRRRRRRLAGRAAFVTNNPRSSTEEYVQKLWGLGIQASAADVVTVGGAMQHLLAETRIGRTAYVIGSEALKRHVADAGLKLLNGTDLATRAEV